MIMNVVDRKHRLKTTLCRQITWVLSIFL